MNLKRPPIPVSTLAALLLFLLPCSTLAASWEDLAKPEPHGRWVQPVEGKPALAVWGHAEGLRVGLPPLPGPRGLLRIYTPYLGQDETSVFNFIAVEPIPKGHTERGFSELEMSDLDGVQGKRLWSADTPQGATPSLEGWPARGVIETTNGLETLTVYVFVEPFQNGAKVYLRLRFRSDRPYEAGVSTFLQEESVELEHCIVTATMGNYARLRNLYLSDGVQSSLALWPNHRGDGFTPHARFSIERLIRTAAGDALFIAAPNEPEPEKAKYDPGTAFWWFYRGKIATQYWRRAQPSPDLAGWVNGRSTYWASQHSIPGGVAFENFELVEPFIQGAEYRFGVTPQTPEEFIRSEKE
jgi:hypothetical protein